MSYTEYKILERLKRASLDLLITEQTYTVTDVNV